MAEFVSRLEFEVQSVDGHVVNYWAAATFSVNLKTYCRLLTGRKFLQSTSSLPGFSNGSTRASFQSEAKMPESSEKLTILVITGSRTSNTFTSTAKRRTFSLAHIWGQQAISLRKNAAPYNQKTTVCCFSLFNLNWL